MQPRIYLYQNEDIAEIYQSLNYLEYLITEFQEQSDNYDLFHNILFEIYNFLYLHDDFLYKISKDFSRKIKSECLHL